MKAIPAGAIVVPEWHERFYLGMPGWQRFTVREIAALPENVRALVVQYGLDEDFDRIVGPVDLAAVTTIDNFINHSCDPNLGYDFQDNVITTRAIETGEELTIDYGCFVVNLDEAWECRCGARGCRKSVRRDDWMKLGERYGYAMPRFLHSRIATITSQCAGRAIAMKLFTDIRK